jgi:ABC-type polysaccharide/polyol phosphate transport system ATPase subunit
VLKILANITPPTLGESRTRGRVASLLEVGTGFHPELTGRENVYLNGAILGMSRRDIATRFGEIVDFSGVEPFLDTPVKRYSSGMYLRLAFAVAAHLEPDVLIVEEILAVGDAEFQRKCLGRMKEAEEEGRTLVFVSHDLEALSRTCPNSIWLDAGRVRRAGPTPLVVREYLNSGLATTGSGGSVLSGGPVKVQTVRVVNDASRQQDALLVGDVLRIEVEFEVTEDAPGMDLAVIVTTAGGVRVLDELLSEGASVRLRRGAYRVALPIPPLLNAGEYTVGLWFGTQHEDFVNEPVGAAPFTVHGTGANRPERLLALGLPFEVHRIEG